MSWDLLIDKMSWSRDLMAYAAMMLIGVLSLYIGFSRDSGRTEKILVSSGVAVFILLFLVLFILKLFNII